MSTPQTRLPPDPACFDRFDPPTCLDEIAGMQADIADGRDKGADLAQLARDLLRERQRLQADLAQANREGMWALGGLVVLAAVLLLRGTG